MFLLVSPVGSYIIFVYVYFLFMLFIQIEEELDDEEEDEEVEGIPEAQEQEAAEFGWFNDLYVLDTGEHFHMKLMLRQSRKLCRFLCTGYF